MDLIPDLDRLYWLDRRPQLLSAFIHHVVCVHELHYGILNHPISQLTRFPEHLLKPSEPTHPTLTLMSNPPPIKRKPAPITLRPRPLHRHISGAHQGLPDVIKAVEDMRPLRV